VGQLWLGGDGVSRGYLNSPELTAEKFMADPFINTNGKRLYKTGDLARWFADGSIQFLGRIDQQVKIRGYRIEPEEIERHLLKHKDIKETVVVLNEYRDKHLSAYIVSDVELTVSELRAYLANILPDYMIPSYFIPIEHIPLNPNGKVDGKALPKASGEIETGVKYIAPENKLEKTIANTWKDVLGLDRVGRNDNFFERGGTSLDIIRLNSKLKEIFGGDISVASMFRYPTIRSFADYLNDTGKEVRIRDEVLDKGKTSKRQRLQKRKELRNYR
jgi:acyl carrier protein